MTAPDDHISHERLMAAFADLSRMIEQRQQQAQNVTGIKVQR